MVSRPLGRSPGVGGVSARGHARHFGNLCHGQRLGGRQGGASCGYGAAQVRCVVVVVAHHGVDAAAQGRNRLLLQLELEIGQQGMALLARRLGPGQKTGWLQQSPKTALCTTPGPARTPGPAPSIGCQSIPAKIDPAMPTRQLELSTLRVESRDGRLPAIFVGARPRLYPTGTQWSIRITATASLEGAHAEPLPLATERDAEPQS